MICHIYRLLMMEQDDEDMLADFPDSLLDFIIDYKRDYPANANLQLYLLPKTYRSVMLDENGKPIGKNNTFWKDENINLKYIPEEECKNEGLFYTKVVEIA